jgi:SAM-dependent methyltransferase
VAEWATLPRPMPEVLGCRCPSCLGELRPAEPSGFRCSQCDSRYDEGPYPGTLAFSKVGANFAQPLDAEIVPRLIPALDALQAPACTERVILDRATELGIPVGNPVWEGRADIARLLLAGKAAAANGAGQHVVADTASAGGGTVALDIGCGFGTFATAVARSAGHVFATDRSPVRVALTAARARAEGLGNLTAFETNGVGLPVGDDVCDLVTIIGVLEWAGVGSGDADAAQRAMLAEVRRVLKPGGVLLLGIENRYAAQYFAGAREDHTDLRFSSLLPRRLADLQSRRVRGVPFETPTHSRPALERLLRESGLHPRVAAVLPSYQQARFAFDAADARAGFDFYVRHAFHPTSTLRRLAARALLRAPAGAITALVPSFWAIAAKEGEPPPVPGVITGSPYCEGAIKAVDWNAGTVTATGRLSGEVERTETLVDGWNARRWVSWPLRGAARARRRRQLLAQVTSHLRDSAVDAEPSSTSDAVREARGGLILAEAVVDEQVLARCGELLDDVPASAPAYREHGDLILNNLVIGRGGQMTPIDRPQQTQPATVGRDAAIVLLDLLSVRAGCKHLDLAAGMRELAVAGEDAPGIGGLLAAAFPGCAPGQIEALMLAGVLRHCAAHGLVRGTPGFLEAAAAGRLAAALR